MQNSSSTDLSAKSERINLRLNSGAKSTLERAARLEGKTLSSFIINCAVSAAKRTITDHETISLTVQESEAFYKALAKPVQFNDKLRSAVDKHDKSVESR